MPKPTRTLQPGVERRLAEMMRNAGLRFLWRNPLGNASELTVTRQGEYSALFFVHAAFYDSRAEGCIRRPQENPSAGAPLFALGPSAPAAPAERTFRVDEPDLGDFEPLFRMVAAEASRYVLESVDEDGLQDRERDLLDGMRLAVVEGGATTLLAQFHAFMVQRSRETDDTAILDDALSSLEGRSAAPSPR